jgi:membrane fusion protein, multidrug efflux system
MTDTSSSANPQNIRRKRLYWIGAAVATTAALWGAYEIFANGNLRTTDDAYVGGHVVQITPEVAGTVVRILADNTDQVHAGAPLVEINPTDARIALAAAEAELAQAVRTVRGLYAVNSRFDAEVALRMSELRKADADLHNRQMIAGSGAVTREDVRHAADAVAAAKAAVDAAEQARAQALAQTKGATLASNPAVQIAAEHVRAAALALERTKIVAPVGGMVAQRTVQLGRRVAPGEKLMAVVPLDRMWIDANFKEVQLKDVCPGQPTKVTADIYGRSVVYHGRVEGVEAGTGAAFALLPAQNATGNWIKVVQRVPVRIRLDPKELASAPLRIGMSATVEINTGACDPKAASTQTPAKNDTAAPYKAQAAAADVTVARVIAANIGVQ